MKLTAKISYSVASFLSAFAVISVTPASVLYIYKGETPAELLNK